MENRDDVFDKRVRDWVEPDRQAVERVMARVLSAPAPRLRFARAFLIAGVTTLLLGSAGFWFWHTRQSDADHYTATFDGDILVVRASDGTYSISGPPGTQSLAVGTWQVAFQGDR